MNTAAATTGIAIIRELIFLPERKDAYNKLILFVFSVLFAPAAVLTWKDNFSVFPAIGSILSTVAFGSSRVRLVRAFAMLSSVCMLIYGIHCFSIPTVINEILAESSIAISFVRERKIKGSRF